MFLHPCPASADLILHGAGIGNKKERHLACAIVIYYSVEYLAVVQRFPINVEVRGARIFPTQPRQEANGGALLFSDLTHADVSFETDRALKCRIK